MSTDAAGNLVALGAVGTEDALGSEATAVTLPDPDVAGIVSMTLGASVTITLAAPRVGGKQVLYITQDGTGSRVATWAAASGSVLFPGGTHALSTTAGYVDRVSFESDGTSWYGSLGLHES